MTLDLKISNLANQNLVKHIINTSYLAILYTELNVVAPPDCHALQAKDSLDSETVGSNSWSKRQASFQLKKDVRYNECPF